MRRTSIQLLFLCSGRCGGCWLFPVLHVFGGVYCVHCAGRGRLRPACWMMDDVSSLLSPGGGRLERAVPVIDSAPRSGAERIKGDLKPFWRNNNQTCSPWLSEGLQFCCEVPPSRHSKLQYCGSLFTSEEHSAHFWSVKSAYWTGVVSPTARFQRCHWCLFDSFRGINAAHCCDQLRLD